MMVSDWEKNILIPLWNDKLLPSTLLEQPIYLLKADTNHTQNYVFESARLPEIRGASLQLSLLNGDLDFSNKTPRFRTMNDALKQIGLSDGELNLSVIYQGGGNLLVLLPSETACQRLQAELEAMYPQTTKVVTIAVVYLASTVRELRESLPEVLNKLEIQLKNYKTQYQPLNPFYERLPFAETCFSCQTRPAAGLDERIRETEYPLCSVCANKLTLGLLQRQYWTMQLYGDQAPDAAPDLDAIAGADGKIAFIYADGDGFGQYMRQAHSLTDYRQRSRHISQQMQESVQVALQDLYARSTEHLLYELITIGGDDVLLLVPAQDAFTVATRLIRHFEADGTLTLSVGIAFGRFNTPVRVLRDIAAQVLREGAKQRKRYTEAQSKQHHGYLDFHDVVREGYYMEGLTTYRYLQQVGSSQRAKLTARPYTVPEFDKLQSAAQGLGEALSGSFLEALSDEVEAEFYQANGRTERSRLFFLYQYSRQRTEARRKISTAIHTLTSDKSLTDWIWQSTPDGQEIYSCVPDIVTLMDIQGKRRYDP